MMSLPYTRNVDRTQSTLCKAYRCLTLLWLAIRKSTLELRQCLFTLQSQRRVWCKNLAASFFGVYMWSAAVERILSTCSRERAMDICCGLLAESASHITTRSLGTGRVRFDYPSTSEWIGMKAVAEHEHMCCDMRVCVRMFTAF